MTEVAESRRSAFDFAEEPIFLVQRIRSLWALAAIGHGIYWVIWRFVFPQPYESLLLRTMAAALGVWITWSSRYRVCESRWDSLLHYSVFVLCIPFFFSYMYLANGFGNRAWAMSLVCAIYLTFFCLRVISGVICCAVGAVAALALLHVRPVGEFSRAELSQGLEILPIFVFALTTGFAGAVRRDQQVRDGLEGAWRALAVLAHEVRSPLFALRAGVVALRRELRDRPGENSVCIVDILDRLDRRITDVNSNVNFHLDNIRHSKAGVSHREPTHYDLVEVVQGAVDTVSMDRGSVPIAYRRTEVCSIHGDPDGARQIVVNLVRNAKAAVAAIGTGQVTLDVYTDGRKGIVVVEDSAGSLSPAIAKQLFSPFFSAKSEGGIGVGLYASRMIAERMRGSLRASHAEGVYTRFELEVPVV